MSEYKDIILGVWLGLWMILLVAYIWSNYKRNLFLRQVVREMERNRQNECLLTEEEKNQITV